MEMLYYNFFLGPIWNLLSIDSVARFSIGSHAIYAPDDKITINLNVTDAPKGIYTLTILPEAGSAGQHQKYSLYVDAEFDRRLMRNDIDSGIDLISTRFNLIDVPVHATINNSAGKYQKSNRNLLLFFT